jgi:hypothetical protein
MTMKSAPSGYRPGHVLDVDDDGPQMQITC